MYPPYMQRTNGHTPSAPYSPLNGAANARQHAYLRNAASPPPAVQYQPNPQMQQQQTPPASPFVFSSSGAAERTAAFDALLAQAEDEDDFDIPLSASADRGSVSNLDEYITMLSDLDDEELDSLPPLLDLAPPGRPTHGARLPFGKQPTEKIPLAAANAPASSAVRTALHKRQSAEKRQRDAGQPWTAQRVISLAGNIAAYLLCAIIIAGTVLFSFTAKNNKSFLGLYFFSVESGSMTPKQQADGSTPKDGFREGDAIVVKKIAPEEVEIGDIITFNMEHEGETKRNTHRVISIIDQWNGQPGLFFLTKGDANDFADEKPVPGKAVVGIKVARLPGVGRIMMFAQKYPMTATVCSAALILTLMIAFVWLSIPRKHKMKLLKK